VTAGSLGSNLTRIEIRSIYVTAQVWLPRLRTQDYKGPHEFVADQAKSLSGAQSERAASWQVFPDGTVQGLTWFCFLVRRDAWHSTALCVALYCSRDHTSRSNDTETPRHIKGNRNRQKRSASLVGSRWEPARGWRKQLAAGGTRVAAALFASAAYDMLLIVRRVRLVEAALIRRDVMSVP
jgi:hypothetical protein